MNDWELFAAMNEAERYFEELKAEFRSRGLHNKPFLEYSRLQPSTDELHCVECGKQEFDNDLYCLNCGRKNYLD